MSEKPEALRLADDPTESKEMYLFMQAAELRRQHADNERLKADNEALRLNDARYRYLRNRDPKEVFGKSGKAAGVWIDWEDDMAGLQLLTGDDADAAIDAAMREDRS